MKRNSVMRRLLAGAATLAVGMVGAVALTTPAQATLGPKGHHIKHASVKFVDNCDETKVKLKSGSILHKYEWTIELENGETQKHELGKNKKKWVKIPKDAGEITVDFKYSLNKHWPQTHTWTEPADCEQPDPPFTDADLVTITSCDLLIFIVRNNSEQHDATVTLTPTQATTHGHVPAVHDLIDVEGDTVELPEDTELVDPQDVDAENSVVLGPFTPTTIHAHGFNGVDGLEVHVLVTAGDNTLFDEVVTWDTEGLDCEVPDEDEGEDGGEGGEEEDEQLPVTGSSTMLIAAGALVLLALGGGLFMIARRRRVSFTA